MKPKLMTAAEAAEYLGITEKTLANWRSSKRYGLAYIKVGHCVRYRQEDLDRFIQDRAVAG